MGIIWTKYECGYTAGTGGQWAPGVQNPLKRLVIGPSLLSRNQISEENQGENVTNNLSVEDPR